MATKTKSDEVSSSQRINLTLSAEIKEIFSAIQKKGNYSHNAMITRFIDIYLKYGENKDDIYRYCDVVLSGDLRESTLQTINDFDLTDVPPIGYDLRNLRNRINVLEKQMNDLCRKVETILSSESSSVHDMDLSSLLSSFSENEVMTSSSSTSTSSSPTVSSNNLSNTTLPTSSLYCAYTLPSSIRVFDNKSLDLLINHELGYGYKYFIQNYSDLVISKEKLTKIEELIETYNTELMYLLEPLCENQEMRNSFRVLGNITALSTYLVSRYKNERNEDITVNLTSLTLQELADIVSKLNPYTATIDFVMSYSTMKQPQMSIKSCLTKQYDFIFKHNPTFLTF